MHRLKQICAIVIVLGGVCLAVDYVRVREKDARVAAAIARCGGRFGSIPVWPLGTEYRVTFPHALTSGNLDELVELNTLRGTVDIAFVDCDLSSEQIDETSEKLFKCTLLRVNKGEMTPLKKRTKVLVEQEADH